MRKQWPAVRPWLVACLLLVVSALSSGSGCGWCGHLKSGQVARFTASVGPLATLTYLVPATEPGSNVTVQLIWEDPAAVLTVYRTRVECAAPPVVAAAEALPPSDPCETIVATGQDPVSRILRAPGGEAFNVHVVGDARLRQTFTFDAMFYSGGECL